MHNRSNTVIESCWCRFAISFDIHISQPSSLTAYRRFFFVSIIISPARKRQIVLTYQLNRFQSAFQLFLLVIGVILEDVGVRWIQFRDERFDRRWRDAFYEQTANTTLSPWKCSWHAYPLTMTTPTALLLTLFDTKVEVDFESICRNDPSPRRKWWFPFDSVCPFLSSLVRLAELRRNTWVFPSTRVSFRLTQHRSQWSMVMINCLFVPTAVADGTVLSLQRLFFLLSFVGHSLSLVTEIMLIDLFLLCLLSLRKHSDYSSAFLSPSLSLSLHLSD